MTTVAEVMTTNLATCRSADSLNRAADLMWRQRIGCVAVLDDAGVLVGVLTDRDVCMAAYAQGRRLDDIPVSAAMSRPARACPSTASLEDAEDLMMAHGVRRLVVVEPTGELRGLVALDDIARRGADWDADGDIDLERAALTLAEISRRETVTDQDGPESLDTDARESVRCSLATLEALRREIGGDLVLSGRELHARWRRLEARLRAAETRARTRPDGARNLRGLVESAARFRAGLRRAVERAATRGARSAA
jgi:CBS domain-containing protein